MQKAKESFKINNSETKKSILTLETFLKLSYIATIFSFFILLFGVKSGHNHVENFTILSISLGLINYILTRGYNSVDKFLLFSLFLYGTILILSHYLHGDLLRLGKYFIYTPFFLLFAPNIKNIKNIIILFLSIGSLLITYLTMKQYLSGTNRPDGFTNAILFSQAIFIYILFNAFFLFTVNNKKLQTIFLINISFLSSMLIITQTRGVWLALITVLLVSLIYKYKTNFLKIIFIIIAITIASISLYNYSTIVERKIDTAILDLREIESNNYNSSWGLRLLAWKSATIDIKRNYLTGIGLDNFQNNKVIQVENKEIIPLIVKAKLHHTHNQYLQNLLIRGVLGFIALILLFIAPFFMKKRKDKNIKLIALINLSFAVFSLSDVPFEHLKITLLYLTSLSIAYLYLKDNNSIVKELD